MVSRILRAIIPSWGRSDSHQVGSSVLMPKPLLPRKYQKQLHHPVEEADLRLLDNAQEVENLRQAKPAGELHGRSAQPPEPVEGGSAGDVQPEVMAQIVPHDLSPLRNPTRPVRQASEPARSTAGPHCLFMYAMLNDTSTLVNTSPSSTNSVERKEGLVSLSYGRNAIWAGT
eukprot:755587-Hanusia_phi.AAC.11